VEAIMHGFSYTLAPELWLLIVASLSRSDLAHLSTTSSCLLYIVRPILYRAVSVTTGIGDTDPSHTLALLARDKELAKCVVELSLNRQIPLDIAPRAVHSLINPDALANLRSLRHIVIRGRVLLTALEQRDFGLVLAGILLEELTYVAYDSTEKWPGDELEGIHDLKKIVWETTYGGTYFHGSFRNPYVPLAGP
jgi:hypothetical protein